MAFAQLSDLEDRLEWDLSDAEQRVGQSTLDDLTELARDLGQNWTDSACPRVVRVAVLAAAVRYMKNLEGAVQSRAGDELLILNEIREGAGSAQFTKTEIESIVNSALGVQGFGTIPILNMGGGRPVVSDRVPVDYGGRPFPWFTPEELME